MSTMSVRSSAAAGVGGGSSSKSRVADHMLFYSVCQATFYVMCFRGDELAAMDGFRDQVCTAGVTVSGRYIGYGWCFRFWYHS